MKRSRIAIIGLGLIGGSLAFRLKHKGHYVVGCDIDSQQTALAQELGAVDEIVKTLPDAAKGADIVFLAVPVGTIAKTFAEIAPYLKKSTIITDVGSVKRPIMNALAELEGSFSFIGGHPMAGREQGGIAAADPNLFENAVYVLVPPPEGENGMAENGSRYPFNMLKNLIEQDLGAHVTIMDAATHDEIVAAVSHMPHVAAAAIVNALGQTANTTSHALALAAGGFRDTTRIASGSPKLWADICLYNLASVLRTVAHLQDQLEMFQEALLVRDVNALEEFFESAKLLREKVPIAQRGLIAPLYEIVVPIPDTPGSINAVTAVLADASLSLKDIGILRQREGEIGALRLGFNDRLSRDQALNILTIEGYRAYSPEDSKDVAKS